MSRANDKYTAVEAEVKRLRAEADRIEAESLAKYPAAMTDAEVASARKRASDEGRASP